MAYIPSMDFSLFRVPSFSPLGANEFGAMTTFNANTPTRFVDFSINQLRSLLQPDNAYPYQQRQFPSRSELGELLDFFQGGQESSSAVRERLRKVRDEADEMYRKAGGSDAAPALPSQGKPAPAKKRGCTAWDILTFNCTPPYMTESGSAEPSDTAVLKSEDASVGANAASVFRNLPAGAGVFLIGIIVIVLLLLFVKR